MAEKAPVGGAVFWHGTGGNDAYFTSRLRTPQTGRLIMPGPVLCLLFFTLALQEQVKAAFFSDTATQSQKQEGGGR